jgi:ATP-dependent Clp protease ATP-binding subunit ClpA
MTLFQRYSTRARRVIFWAHLIARKEQAQEITSEHILRGILKEDPDLFAIVAPGATDLANQIERVLASMAVEQTARKELESPPLSASAKVVVAGAGREQKRLGQRSVATQHLLLALVKSYERSAGWFARRKHFESSKAQQVLLDHGITPAAVESKIREGIVTATTAVPDDPVLKLNAQLTAIAELLISKGFFRRSEFVELLDQNEDPLTATTFLVPLIEALFQKGKITATEKDTIGR